MMFKKYALFVKEIIKELHALDFVVCMNNLAPVCSRSI